MTIRPEPLPLEFDAQGDAVSSRFGDRFASADGALGQAHHVFLDGNDISARWRGREHFTVLETGFGLGVNFLATWLAWRHDSARPKRLHFVSLEKHPIAARDQAAWGQAFARIAGQERDERRRTELEALHACLLACWPLPLPGLHRLGFDAGAVTLTLGLGDALQLAAQLSMGADALYLDGFAPDRNPEMWSPSLLRALARLMRTGATAASYSCAGEVRRGLGECGFRVERAPGFGSKREMLRATFAPQWKVRRHEPPRAFEGARDAIVIGAGLAGASVAYALRRRGWAVRVLDRAGAPARAASALPVGLLAPLLSADDNLASRASRAGFLFTLSLLANLAPQGLLASGKRLWARTGVFRLAGAGHDEPGTGHAASSDWPAPYALELDATAASERLGVEPARGGTWFEQGALVDAGAFTREMLAQIDVARFHAQRIERRGNEWRVHASDGTQLSAPVLVLANALGAEQLWPHPHAQLDALHGRITFLQGTSLAKLRAPISGDGYLLPASLGTFACGAGFDRERTEEQRADLENLQRAQDLVESTEFPVGDLHATGGFSGERCVARDRLPLAGPLVDEADMTPDLIAHGAHLADLPRCPGLYSLIALGSRGLSLAPILGETVACLIEGEPAPIEKPLLDAVDPARFLLRHLR